ncbi:MAG: ATP-dependent sacrificial sulfur transferase LarE [Deltaproteobacteria bacterium]|nr:ATP-dependent sacrificial sulfur transferase LarE [Deltaproteobacteria bacterium]
MDDRVESAPTTLEALCAHIAQYPSVLVCFSGGVDSAVVLAASVRALGDRAAALTTISPSLANQERAEAEAFARSLGAKHFVEMSEEIDDPNYAANSVRRCYYCKSELYRISSKIAGENGFSVVANGTNFDDLGDYRPGLDAAREAGVRSPMVELKMRKTDVRAVAQELGLSLWDKPAAACLSSRIPYGTAVTRGRLAQIETVESGLRSLGFVQFRVRYHDKIARIEVGTAEIARAASLHVVLTKLVKSAGFSYATLDLEGYRMGSHNEVIGSPVRLPVIS